MRILIDKGGKVSYNDPFVPSLKLAGKVFESVEISSPAVQEQDCLIILTDHSSYDFERILADAKLAIDTRNATKDLHELRDRIIKLGAGNGRAAPLTHDELDDVSTVRLAANR